MEPESTQGVVYKIRLASGRILGPLDLERVRNLILKNQITGIESARKYPQGEWVDINTISEIADLLVARISGDLVASHSKSYPPLTPVSSGAATQVLAMNTLDLSSPQLQTNSVIAPPDNVSPPEVAKNVSKPAVDEPVKEEPRQEDDDKTRVEGFEEPPPAVTPESTPEEEDKTRVSTDWEKTEPNEAEDSTEEKVEMEGQAPAPADLISISHEHTVVLQRPASTQTQSKRPATMKEMIKGVLVALVLGTVGYEVLLAEPEKPAMVRPEPIRPKLPAYIQGKSDPNKSSEVYLSGMRFYVADTVVGYRAAAEKLRISAGYDIANVKALAMLASSYINLIDSSNKDENYFSVISKLINMSRAKDVDLSETVIADVEFFLVVNKAEAAQNRIVEYTKSHQNFGLEMFYYLALTFYERGDAVNAARYISQIADNKAFSAKIFYLRGRIAEKLNDPESAIREYKKAIQFNRNHAKSYLRIVEILSKRGTLKEAKPFLEFLITHITLLSPQDLGQAYFLHAQFEELFQKWAFALNDVERAVKLVPDNHDYLLELYTLRAKSGDSLQSVQKQARMYYFLGEGEKLIQQGKFQEALGPLLQARQANDESPLPLVKIGDMFNYLQDVEHAKSNYKLATERAPNDIKVWSKYINTLIQSFEWEEAKKAMDKFRKLPVSQSAIDKAAADMYQKQGKFVEAQTYYKKAMARESVDSDVYISYAKSLMSTRNFKDAPFFFALALRFDPLNVDATVSTAKCVAETESIDRAMSMLQDELKQGTGARAEFLATIAEFQIQKGDWEQAQQSVNQAMQMNPDYAYPWKLQAQIYMNRESTDKAALDNALSAYKSYSDRNPSDPSGYLERYKIYANPKKAEFEKAKEELARIYTIFPKYPNLHYYSGALFSLQGNHRAAAEEFKLELANNPDAVQTIISYGKELLEQDQVAEALKYFTKAMQIDSRSVEAKQSAGWANYRLKNYVAAVSLLTGALAIDKANPTVYRRLGIVYRDMGDMGSACTSFRKYLQMEPDAPDKEEFRQCL